MADYYDAILIAIAAIVAVGWLVGAVTAVPMEYARIASVLAATPFVYHAFFMNPPLPPDDVQRAAAAVVWHALFAWTLIDAFF